MAETNAIPYRLHSFIYGGAKCAGMGVLKAILLAPGILYLQYTRNPRFLRIRFLSLFVIMPMFLAADLPFIGLLFYGS